MPISLYNRRNHRVDATPVDRLDAAGADSQRHLPSKTGNPVGLLLNIEVEAPLRSTVGVGDGVSKPGVAPVTWQTRAMALPHYVGILARAYPYCN